MSTERKYCSAANVDNVIIARDRRLALSRACISPSQQIKKRRNADYQTHAYGDYCLTIQVNVLR